MVFSAVTGTGASGITSLRYVPGGAPCIAGGRA